MHMTSTAPQPQQDSRPAVAAPGQALAHTAEQAARIIGGNCKASWLKQQAREGKIPALKIGGAWNFTSAHIAEIIAFCEVPAARQVSAAPAPAKRPSARRKAGAQADTLPFPPASVVQLRARAPRKRDVA